MENSEPLGAIAPTATTDRPILMPEDWGGDGRSGMNLSGRCTAIAAQPQPRQYQFLDSQAVPVTPWQIAGSPAAPWMGTQQVLSWHQNGAVTAKVVLPPEFELPAGRFTADIEIFVLQGTLQIDDWQLQSHSYTFIPAGVRVGQWQVLGESTVELLWMTNQQIGYQDAPHQPESRLSEWIPLVDSKRLSWGKTDTSQFVTASKKWLRKAANGGGTWLLTLLPHYDGGQMMIQAYNEEAYGLAGTCHIGDYPFAAGHFAYCPSFSTLPRHISTDGSLFFVRVDRDLSQPAAVISYAPQTS